MSGVIVVRHLLANNTPLVAVVPSNRIIAGVLPQKTQVPAIGVIQISGIERLTAAMTAGSRMVTDRVQVTVYGKAYADVKRLLVMVRAALPNTRGMVNDIACDSVLPDLVGPDSLDADSMIFEQSQDFFVRYNRTI